MRYLTNTQKQLLKKVQNSESYNCTNISNDELKTINFLRSEGFLDAQTTYAVYPTRDGEIATAETGIESVQISEAGKAYFAELTIDYLRYRIPLILSIISLILSGLAFYASSNPQKTEIINTVTIATSSDAIDK